MPTENKSRYVGSPPSRGVGGRTNSVGVWVLLSLTLASSAAAQSLPVRDLDACVSAKKGSGWQIDFKRSARSQLDDVVQQIVEDREAIITYMDETLPRDLDSDVVRNIIWDITDQLLHMRCLDQRAGEQVEQKLFAWMGMVEQALHTAEQRRCMEYCEHTVPQCDPLDCL